MPIITLTVSSQVIELRLRDSAASYEHTAEVLLDVNQWGNWVRRLELLGSGINFSLERALSHLISENRVDALSIENSTLELSVKYDEDANAAFLYLTDRPASAKVDPSLLKPSYTVNDDMAIFGLGSDLALVFIRFRIPPSERIDDFTRFLSAATVDRP